MTHRAGLVILIAAMGDGGVHLCEGLQHELSHVALDLAGRARPGRALTC